MNNKEEPVKVLSAEFRLDDKTFAPAVQFTAVVDLFRVKDDVSDEAIMKLYNDVGLSLLTQIKDKLSQQQFSDWLHGPKDDK